MNKQQNFYTNLVRRIKNVEVSLTKFTTKNCSMRYVHYVKIEYVVIFPTNAKRKEKCQVSKLRIGKPNIFACLCTRKS